MLERSVNNIDKGDPSTWSANMVDMNDPSTFYDVQQMGKVIEKGLECRVCKENIEKLQVWALSSKSGP